MKTCHWPFVSLAASARAIAPSGIAARASAACAMAACAMVSCAFAALASAQAAAPTGRVWAFEVAAGDLNVTRRDETSSSLRFGDDGFLGRVGVARTSQRYELEAALQGAATKLHTSAAQSNEQFSTGELNLIALRSVRSRGGIRLDAGVAINTRYDDTFHRFDQLHVSSTTYRFAMVTADPMLRVEISRRLASLDLRLSAPLVGLVDHPFSNVKNGNAPIDLRFRTLNTLRAVNSVVAITTNNRQIFRARAAFRAGALANLDEQPVHAFRSSLTLGIVIGYRLATK